MKIACIDVGSNSIKLVVVDAAASDSFAVLAREKDPVRLGHDTLRDEQLSPAAIERATESIKRLRSIAEARGAEHIFAVATASVREARNSAQLIKEIQRKAGVSLEVLSAIEEARLIGLAAAQGCAGTNGSILNVDIGGGSTEISLMRESSAVALFSVKLGAVGLSENFINSDPPRSKELKALREEVRSALERPARELKGMKWQQATGTSGTIVAIGTALRLRALSQDDRRAEGARPAGDEIAVEKLTRFNARASEMNAGERRALPGISSQRSEILIAGGQILEGVMQALKIDSMRTCSWALREGVLIEWTDTNIANTTFEGSARELLRVQYNTGIHPMGDISFNPTARKNDTKLRLDLARIDFWLGKGAQQSERVASLAKTYRKQATVNA